VKFRARVVSGRTKHWGGDGGALAVAMSTGHPTHEIRRESRETEPPTRRHRTFANPNRLQQPRIRFLRIGRRSIDAMQPSVWSNGFFEMTVKPRRCCRNRYWVGVGADARFERRCCRPTWWALWPSSLIATPRRPLLYARTPTSPLHLPLLAAGNCGADACKLSSACLPSCRKLTGSSLLDSGCRGNFLDGEGGID